MKVEGLKKVFEIAESVKIAMLVTQEDKGILRSRPMTNAKVDKETKNIWFFTEAYSPKVAEIEEEHSINLAYSNPKTNEYLSISGKAFLVKDQEKIEALWNPIVKAWFPEGKQSKDLALLRVEPLEAAYWDSDANQFVELYRLGKALLTESTYEGGAHQKLNL